MSDSIVFQKNLMNEKKKFINRLHQPAEFLRC